jgi:NAD(P)H-flavin reductase
VFGHLQHLREVTAGAMNPIFHRIERVRREVRDVFTLEMTPADGSMPLPFAPGQFNMLYAFGIGEVPISISGDLLRPERLVHTIRSVGAVTQALCRMKRGDLVGVRGPFGTHWPLEAAEGKDVVIIAGGLGLVPLCPAIHALLARRKYYGSIALLYGTRTPEDLLYARDLARWEKRTDVKLEITVDAAGPGWHGHVGLVTKFIPRLRFDPRRSVAMVCGPEIMMRFTLWELLKCGLAPEDIFLSMERNMKCGVGLCGHCQFGPFFVCKDGPVFPFEKIKDWFERREV